MDTDANPTPPEATEALRDSKGRWLTRPPGSAPIIDSRAKALEMRERRTKAWEAGTHYGLKRAAADDAGLADITTVGAAAHYAKAIGDGILANATERPLDAARALNAVRNVERSPNARSLPDDAGVYMSKEVAEAWLARKQ